MSMSVSLPNELADFVKAKVDTGRYGSSSEVVREALRLLEWVEQQNAEKLEYLRKAWQEGNRQRPPQELDMKAVLAEGRKRLAASKA